jgi:hypothetical protein
MYFENRKEFPAFCTVSERKEYPRVSARVKRITRLRFKGATTFKIIDFRRFDGYTPEKYGPSAPARGTNLALRACETQAGIVKHRPVPRDAGWTTRNQ